jgi:2-keto-4-pentenoate hydratase
VDLEDVARELSAARLAVDILAPPSERLPGFTIEDGFRVATLLHRETIASGRSQVGWKLGFTNQQLWARMGLDRPFCAPIYDHTVIGPGQVSLEGLVAPRIEPEIVVGFKTGLLPGSSTSEVSDAMGWAALGFEIVQCHFPSWKFQPADAIADAGLHGRLVVGDRIDLASHDAPALADVEVELRRDGVTVEKGRGSSALGGPARAISWLLELPGFDGLGAGDVVTTGTLTAPPPIQPGETWELSSTGPVALGQLKVQLAAHR